MKKSISKVIFIVILLLIILSINVEVQAWSNVIKDGKDFIKTGESSGEGTVDQSAMQGLSGYLYNILLAAGVVVAVVVATVLGIQFMIGGAEGQAKVKEMLVPFIVGCVVVFGGFGLWKIAVTLGNEMENADERVTTSTPGEEGEIYCTNCGGVISSEEKAAKKCFSCGKEIVGL